MLLDEHTTPWQSVIQQAEAEACPAVFRGINQSWPALFKWAGSPGLQYLQETAGDATVQAMYSNSSHFFGDIQHHEAVQCTLRQLLDVAAQQQQQQQQPHLYLAQQPLTGPGLCGLLSDVPVPDIIGDKQLTSINMWWSSRSSRSSLHYDPYQNLLCVVTGCKTVRLYPPAAVLGLYPRALGGEASNHSSVNFAEPDDKRHPLYRHALAQCIQVSLQPGDALFLPEGWWHQVDSADMTLAVNFWWSSHLTSRLRSQPHQHHYYLRMLLASTSNEAVEQLLAGTQPWTPQAASHVQQGDTMGSTLGRPDGQAGAAAGRPDSQAGAAASRPDSQAGAAAGRSDGQAVAAAGMPDSQAGAEKGRPDSRAGADSQYLSPEQDSLEARTAKKRSRVDGTSVTPAAAAAAAVPAAAAGGTSHKQRALIPDKPAVVLDDIESAALRELYQVADALQETTAAKHRRWTSAWPGERRQQQNGLSPPPAAAAAAAAVEAAGAPQQQQQQQTTTRAGSALEIKAACASLLADAEWWGLHRALQQELLCESIQGSSAKSLGDSSSSSSDDESGGSQDDTCDNSSSSNGTSSRRGTSSSSSIPSDSYSSGGGVGANQRKASCAPYTKTAPDRNRHTLLNPTHGTDLGLRHGFSCLIAGLQPQQLVRVLWLAAAQSCRSVAALLLHGLGPAAAQLLTDKLEAADEYFMHEQVPVKQQQQQGVDHCQVPTESKQQQQQQQCCNTTATEHQPQDHQQQQHGSGGDYEGVASTAVVPFTRSEFYSRLYGTVPDPGVMLGKLLKSKARLVDAATAVIVKAHTAMLL